MIQAKEKSNSSAEVELDKDTFQIWVKRGEKTIHLTFFEANNEVDIVSWTPKGTKITKRSYKFGRGR